MTTTNGKVYIASMNLRGAWATKIDPNSVAGGKASKGEPSLSGLAKAPEGSLGNITLNVTSAQGKLNHDRLAFSPMTEIPGGYKGYDRFESYWQSGKVFEGIPEDKSKAWWKAQTTAKRRYPPGKGKTVLYATFEDHPEPLDYVSAREEVYVKEYYNLIKDRARIHYYEQLFSKCVRISRSAYVERTLDIQMLKSGRSITIYDFDGPRTEDGGVTCLELDLDLLRSKIQIKRSRPTTQIRWNKCSDEHLRQ